MSKRVAVQWARLGPYHLARLRAAHRALAAQGGTLIALETCAHDETYAWRVEATPEPFERRTVFLRRPFHAIGRLEMMHHVWQALNHIDPDAVAVSGYRLPDAQSAIFWALWRRRRLVLMSENKQDDAPRRAWLEQLKGLLVRRFDAAICGGTLHRAYLLALGMGADDIYPCYDVVDNAYFGREAAKARREPAATRHLPGLEVDHAPFFLCSARFLPRKNVDGLLAAYALVRRDWPENAGAAPWRLVILGDGPERERLAQYVTDSGLDGVTFAGFRQIDELPAYYARAGVLIHPAWNEPWGLVVNEAMASGLPVIVSSRCGCAPELVHDGVNGFQFDPADTAGLARHMLRVASRASERAAMGEQSRQIIAGFGPDCFAGSLLRACDV